MVDVRFALALVSFVKPGGKLQCSAGLLPFGRAVKPRGLELKPGPQSPLTVNGGDGVQRHHRDELAAGEPVRPVRLPGWRGHRLPASALR